MKKKQYNQDSSVEQLFKDYLAIYTKKGQALDSFVIPHVLTWLKNKKTRGPLHIGEFGGGAGQLLNKIRLSYPKATYTNVEIVGDYKRFLVSKHIRFVKGSILHPDFPDNSFDVLIMRDVIHHLVGKSWKETLRNQQCALGQLQRMVKPGGAIFIEELTNTSEPATRMMYELSRLNAVIPGMSMVTRVNPHTIVAFTTPKSLQKMCEREFDSGKITMKLLYNPRKTFKLTDVLHFGMKAPKAVITVEKQMHR